MYRDAKNSAGERNERVCCSVLSCIELIIIIYLTKWPWLWHSGAKHDKPVPGDPGTEPHSLFPAKKLKNYIFSQKYYETKSCHQ